MSPSGTVHINGQELYYEIHGHGPPLVLVMELDTTVAVDAAQVPGLFTRFGVVLLDIAMSVSPRDHPYTIAEWLTTSPVWSTRSTQRTHLLGLSMGAMIGMEFRCDMRIVSSAGTRRTGCSARSQRCRPDLSLELGQGKRPQRRRFARSSSPGCSPRPSCATSRRYRTRHIAGHNPNPVEPDAYDRQAQAYLQFDAIDRLGGITAPTMVIVVSKIC